jgi:three-Cys-motif partner protein
MTSRVDFLQNQNDDGFVYAPADSWQSGKQKLIQHYLKANFNRLDLRNKHKIYLDIGCGPGYMKINNTGEKILGSPLMALAMEEQFSRYIFCDQETNYTNALKIRTKKYFPDENVLILDGDINQVIETLPHYLPAKQGKFAVSVLALIDTFSFDVHFETIEWLSEMGVDILFINAFPHTGIHNFRFYLDEQRELLNDFFGSSWARVAELNKVQDDAQFFMLIVKAYMQRLKSLSYKVASSLHKYDPPLGYAPFYQIAYCTKSRLFESVKKEVVKSSNQQIDIFQ